MSNTIGALSFDDGDIPKFSLSETIKAIDDIEKMVLSQYFISLEDPNMMIVLIETTDDIYTKVSLIRNKVSEDKFNEDLPRNWKNKKESLLSKLLYLSIVTQHYRDTYRMWNLSSNLGLQVADLQREHEGLVDDYNKKKEELEGQIHSFTQTINQTLETQTGLIEDTKEETIEEVQGAEGKIVSHVLSLMSVFTAVITIILSVVVTSSSWLNNASGASAIIAFVIPNMVTLIAVISIVLLVSMYQKIFYPPLLPKGEKAKKSPTIITAILLFIILSITIYMSVFAYRTVRAEPHLRYVLDQTEYTIIEKQDSNTDETHKYIEFVFEGESYVFPYDVSYFRESKLYFCPKHKSLE